MELELELELFEKAWRYVRDGFRRVGHVGAAADAWTTLERVRDAGGDGLHTKTHQQNHKR